MDEILNDAKSIIDGAADEWKKAQTAEIAERLQQVEQQLWQSHGASHLYELYLLVMEASGVEQVKEFKDKAAEDQTIVAIGSTDEEAMGVLSMKPILNSADLGDEAGDLVQALSNQPAAIYYSAVDNHCGYIFRTEAFASETANDTGKKPSDSDDRQDVTVTGIFTGHYFCTAVRNHKTNEVIVSDVIDANEVDPNGDTPGRVFDALLAFTYGPLILKREKPEMYEAMIKDVTAHFDKS